ncbi:hypothetical protein AncyloWKF20_19175 [Ancylobacter sp. WKF20]|uniref:hypothetical protein n=1 Tax=Ancylobacter sp. WKF20 TaxID=3039801 RepID=UPI0024343817|nr:hypothetical protein [Ancylobacter sp. WKF20]WGD29849.1 hypothetical protein AncyloWKF20_19175 [Ancylobacter sp. WKF20]
MTNPFSGGAPVKEVIVTGDIFRLSAGGGSGNQDRNISWLHALLKFPIFAATGTYPGLLRHDNSPLKCSDIYDAAGLRPSLSAWAELSAAFPKNVSERYASLFQGKIVVGFELSNAMCAALTEWDVPYICILTHPVRFLDDIAFAVSTNISGIHQGLAKLCMREAICFEHAGFITAYFASRRRSADRADFRLFAAQTHDDRSLFRDGAIVSQDWIGEKLVALYKPDDVVAFKHHPLKRSAEVFEKVKNRCANTYETSANVYSLLSDPNLSDVITVSSSVGVEAKYFGKNVTYLHKPFVAPLYRNDTSAVGDFMSCGTNLLSADFWRILLSTFVPVSDLDGHQHIYRPDLLRATLNQDWNFGEIYADFIVQSSPLGRVMAHPSVWARLKNKLMRQIRRS